MIYIIFILVFIALIFFTTAIYEFENNDIKGYKSFYISLLMFASVAIIIFANTAKFQQTNQPVKNDNNYERQIVNSESAN
jgi:predicted tellurium resistance membrane protein TerC